MIDYLQLMKGIGRFQNRNAEISEFTRALKLLAVEESVNIHVLSQLSRDNMREKRPPALHDLRDSGSIEQDADAVAFVWRPEMLLPGSKQFTQPGQAEANYCKTEEWSRGPR